MGARKVLDTFTGANNTDLTSRSPDQGPNWASSNGSVWQIQSNAAKKMTSGPGNQDVIVIDAGVANQTVILDATTPVDAGLILNWQDDLNYWLLEIDGGAWIIYEQQAGGFTNRGSGSGITTVGTHTWIGTAIDDTIALFYDGVMVGSYTVASRKFKTRTKCGMRAFFSDQTPMDNFKVYEGGWIPIGSLGTVSSITANQASLVLTTSAVLNVGEVGVIVIAVDNNQTTDGDEGAVTGVVDSAGNTWSKAGEFTNGQGAAQAGSTCSIWYVKAGTQLASGGTITASFNNTASRDASAATAYRFLVASTAVISVAGTATLAGDNVANPGSLDLTTSDDLLLRLRGDSIESDASALTATAGWKALTDAAPGGGSAATRQSASGEFRVWAGTGSASNPSNSNSRDHASVYVALKEASPQALTVSIGGTLTSSGALSKQGQKSLAGAVASSGAISKQGQKHLTGAVPSAGVLTKRGALSFAGAVPSAGVLSKQAGIGLAGSVSPVGDLIHQANLHLAGLLTVEGSILIKSMIALAGSVSPSGVLSHVSNLVFSGSITPSGQVVLQDQKQLAGSLTPVGGLSKEGQITLAGSVSPSGDLSVVNAGLVLTGTLAVSGELRSVAALNLAGLLDPVGSLVLQGQVHLAGVLDPSGNLTTSRFYTVLVGGSVTPSGIVVAVMNVVPDTRLLVAEEFQTGLLVVQDLNTGVITVEDVNLYSLYIEEQL